MLSIQTHISEKLSLFIKSFWCLKVDDNLKAPYLEEVLPDGHHEIIFNYRLGMSNFTLQAGMCQTNALIVDKP